MGAQTQLPIDEQQQQQAQTEHVVAPELSDAAQAVLEAAQQQRSPILDRAVEQTIQNEADRLKVEEGKFEFQQRRAKLFAASGLFGQKDLTAAQSIAQAMVRIELGEAMGLTPAESLQGIDVIQGRAAISSAIRAARMQAAGYSWDIDWREDKGECVGCRLWLYFRGRPVMQIRRDAAGMPLLGSDGKIIMDQVSVAYLRTDAQRMLTTIWQDNQKKRVSILEKDNWKMSPKNMYFARAVTNLQRWHAPAVLNPNIPSIEEAQDFDVAEQNGAHRFSTAVNLEQVVASQDANRGHDAAATAPPKDEPPADLPHHSDWPETAEGDWLWVGDTLYRFSDKSGNYHQHSLREFAAPAETKKGKAK